MIEIVGAVTLLNPTWSIVRHPFRFSRFRVNPGNAVHYLYASLGVALIVTKWTDVGARIQDGGDAAPFIALINRALAGLGPNARLDGADGLPVFLLVGNIIGGLTSYFVCRWVARRQGVTASPALSGEATISAQTLAANAYICGAAGIIYAIGLLCSRGSERASARDRYDHHTVSRVLLGPMAPGHSWAQIWAGCERVVPVWAGFRLGVRLRCCGLRDQGDAHRIGRSGGRRTALAEPMGM